VNRQKAKSPAQVRHPAYEPYKSSVIILGLAAIGYAMVCLAGGGTSPQWLILAFLTVFTSSLSIRIPTVNSKISVGDTLTFTNIVLFGLPAGIITAALDALMGSIRARTKTRRLEYILFNVSATAFSAVVAGSVFFHLLGRRPLFKEPAVSVQELIFPIGMLALIHYLLNSGSVATIVALELRKSIYHVWRDSFLWTSITYFAGAAAAGIIALEMRSVTPGVLGVIVLVVLAIYFTYRTYLDKVLELNKLYLSTVEALATAIDAKDQVTHGHVRRVQVFARGLARESGITDENALRWIEAGALLHDIGKLAIPEYILNKPGKLTRSEFKKVMIHPAVGSDILSSIRFPYSVADDVRHHHENWDGTGYPDKLQGEQIPLGARILAVVDCYDALTCDRPYRAAMSRDEAVDIIHSRSGRYYDPQVVQKFEEILENLELQVREVDIHELKIESSKTIAEHGRTFEDNTIPRADDIHIFQNILSTHREVSALYELAQTLGSTLILEETLPVIAGKIAKLVPSTTCVIYLHSMVDDTLAVKHVSGDNVDLFRDYTMPFGQNLSGWVAAHNHPGINVDPVFDLLPFKNKLTAALNNALVYPLYYKNLCLGTISLYASGGFRFEEDHVRIMEIIAKQAAMAIFNALKYEETQEDPMTDPLTGLPNARYLDLCIEQEFKTAECLHYPIAVLGMDLVGFKSVNDRHGHHVGNLMLVEVAKVLRRCVDGSGVVVRCAGGEFVALLGGADAEDASHVASRIQEEVDEIRLEFLPGKFAEVGISVGVACYPTDGNAAEVLLEKAGLAMYQDKKRRNGMVCQLRREPSLPPLGQAQRGKETKVPGLESTNEAKARVAFRSPFSPSQN